MKITSKIYNKIIVLLLGLAAIFACTDLDETHEEFITNGEDIYVGKPVEVFTNSGNKRIKFNVVISADPKISKGKITWSGGSESYDFDVTRAKEGIDTLAYEFNINEGSYAFEVTLMDNQGNSSLKYEHTALVYGDKYIASLFNRGIDEIVALPGQANITWATPEVGVVKTLFGYEDNNGEMQEIVVLPEDSETTIVDYKVGGAISLATVYKPTEDALDEFESMPEDRTFPSSVLLDRSLWLKVDLPTDGDLTCYGGSVPNLWDGDKGSWYHNGCIGDGTDGIPHHFTIDLGVMAGLSKFKISPRQDCCQDRNPKRFQVWGRQDLEGAETTASPDDPNWADDATAKGWVLLLDAESDASWNGSKDDFEIDIPDNESVRYIRFRFLEAFNGGSETALSEFVFSARSID